MREFLILVFAVLFVSNLTAQTIQVLNAKTGKPVEGVLLFTEKLSTQTDNSGKASLEIFQEKERIIFKHSSFLKFISTREKIEKQGRIVLLIEDPVRLDEVIVSVNRWKQSKTEIPHTIKSIQVEDVLHYNPQTTADLLGTKGGVFIQKSQMGGGSPMIRGFSANRVLIVVDGIRLNNAIFRSGNIHNVISIDAISLENTEIIFGPGSVIYGSDALGGVMSFNTLKPKLSTSEKREQHGKLFSRLSSSNFEKTLHGTFNLGSKKWAGLISATVSNYNDLRMGSNGPEDYKRNEYVVNDYLDGDYINLNENPLIQKPTGYSQLNAIGKLRFRPNENMDLLLSVNHSETGDIPRYDRLIQYANDELRYADWYYGPQKWTLVSGKFEYVKKHTLFDKMNILIGYQDYEENRNDRKLNSDWLRSRKENLGIWSANLDFGKVLDKKNEIYYGLEAYYNHVNSIGISENLQSSESTKIASRYPDDSNYANVAGYYSFKFNLNKSFIFQAGSRFTYTQMKGKFDTNYYNFGLGEFNTKSSAFNGNLGIVWHPTQDWQINLHSSTGFRAPNIDDIAKVFDSEPGNVVVPNPELKPEYARNLELSVLRSYSSKARIEITGFYTWLKNAMVRRDFSINGQDSLEYDGVMSNVEAIVNAESATIMGANFNFEYLFNRQFRTKNDLSITKGNDSEGIPLRHVPPTFGSSHLIYEDPRLFIDLYVEFNGILNHEDLAPDEINKPHLYLADSRGDPYSPSWWTLNLKTNYKITRDFILAGGVENIFDKRYRPYSSGVVSPGINFIFSGYIHF